MPALDIKWIGLKRLQRNARAAEKTFKDQLRKSLRAGANTILRSARRNARSMFDAPTGLLARSMKTAVRVRARRDPYAIVGSLRRRAPTKSGRRAVPAWVYGTVHTRGGPVRRPRPGRSTRRFRPHTAVYRKRPIIENAVRANRARVYLILGRSFRIEVF